MVCIAPTAAQVLHSTRRRKIVTMLRLVGLLSSDDFANNSLVQHPGSKHHKHVGLAGNRSAVTDVVAGGTETDMDGAMENPMFGGAMDEGNPQPPNEAGDAALLSDGSMLPSAGHRKLFHQASSKFFGRAKSRSDFGALAPSRPATRCAHDSEGVRVLRIASSPGLVPPSSTTAHPTSVV